MTDKKPPTNPQLMAFMAECQAIKEAPAAQPALKPLTNERIFHLVDTHVGEPNARYPLDKSDWMHFARAIEAAHGIKGDA